MTDLHVSKQSIREVLTIQGKKYVVPAYQRPYRWSDDECGTLWEDIVEAKNNRPDDDYFLGTIVTCLDKEQNREVIDGQQRLTSFFLLLRAFCYKLESQNASGVSKLISDIRSCIWDTDPRSGEVADASKIHIESKAIDDSANEIFHQILKTGKCSPGAKDNYSLNYRFFMERSDEFAEEYPAEWQDLCVFILTRCIILPIECANNETALTIFNTLNDRGMPLSTSDIFKARLYENCKTAEKKDAFISAWKKLNSTCDEAGLSVDDIFRYYMHILRARTGTKKREVGLDKFYTLNEPEALKKPELMSDLNFLAGFWNTVNNRQDADLAKEGYCISLEAKKWLHCFSWYPNEYWKYPVSAFALTRKGAADFDAAFCRLLKNLMALLFAKFIEKPSINAIRSDTYNAYIAIVNGNKIPGASFDETALKNLAPEIVSSPKIARALLLLDAYLNPGQNGLIPVDFQIEHIFPRKWETANYNGWSQEAAKDYLEKFGNKVVIEKECNIHALNHYFAQKKNWYRQESHIAAVRDLAALPQDDWLKDDIERRESVFVKRIVAFFKENMPGT
jgi:hypothetical protein